MSNGARTPEGIPPRASAPANPGTRLSGQPLPRVLRGRHVCLLRWMFPPLACLIHLSRLVAAPRYFGPEPIPRTPWPALHVFLLSVGLATGQWVWLNETRAENILTQSGTQIVEWKTAAEAASGNPGWQGTALGILGKVASAAESVVRFLGEHLEVVLPVILVYLVTFGLAHLLFGVNRVHRRRVWVKIQDLLLYLKGAEMPVVRRGRRAHEIVNFLFLLTTALLLASGWWLVIPALPASWGLPDTLAGLPLGWVISGAVAAIWLALLVLAVRPRFAKLMAGVEPPLPVLKEEEADLPHLTLDGTIPIPQLPPGSPLQETPQGLEVMPGDRGADRRFATLTAIGHNEGCRYVPNGNTAAETRWLTARLEVAGGGTWWKPAAEAPKPEFTMPTPAQLTESLCRVMYQASAVEGIVGKRPNAVIRDFCTCHELCLMVTEDELASLLHGLAASEWPRRSGEQTAAAIQSAFEGFDSLPSIEEYLAAWMDHEPGATGRFRAGEFDPLRNGRFRNLQMDFTALGRGLVQAIIFADRRIDAGESDLAQRLSLDGDFESDVEPTEVTP